MVLCISKPLMHINSKTVLVSIIFPTCVVVHMPTTIALKFSTKMYSLQQTLNCSPHKCDDYNRTNLYIRNSLPDFNVMPNNTIGVAKEKIDKYNNWFTSQIVVELISRGTILVGASMYYVSKIQNVIGEKSLNSWFNLWSRRHLYSRN